MKQNRYHLPALLFLAWILNGCYIEFAPPPPASCPIRQILLSESELPGEDWYQNEDPRAKAAPLSIGVERIGVGFSHGVPYDGATMEVYRLINQRTAYREYKKGLDEWFNYDFYAEEWILPAGSEVLDLSADQYKVACNKFEETRAEQCNFLAQYDVYMIRFGIRRQGLEHEDFAESVKRIDEKMNECLSASD